MCFTVYKFSLQKNKYSILIYDTHSEVFKEKHTDVCRLLQNVPNKMG